MIAAQAVEALGVIGVVIMVTSYALERRSVNYVAVFSFGCAVAAIYALLIGSYPFLVAEAIWALIAYRRWRRGRAPQDLPPSEAL